MKKTQLDFDELNILSKSVKKRYPKVIPYREYFGAMYISPEKMKSRIDFAEQIEDVMLWVFAYWLIAAEAEISKEELKQDAKEKLTSVIAKRTKLDPYLENHIDKVIDEVVDTTEKHTKKQDDEDEESDISEFLYEDEETEPFDENRTLKSETDVGNKDKSYWTSRERAMLISENEANAFDNYIEYREAKVQGKTKKVWITELDEKVRLTHQLAEGQTVDIDGLFFVGESKMRFPMDTMYDASPRETVNCRCVCKYE